MKKTFFLLNNISDFDFADLIKQYLADVNVTVGEILPQYTEEYDLIVLWNYRKIIKSIGRKRNIIIFHSSDLPKGRGWAPIYNALSSGHKFYVISGILPGETADTGNLVVKAKFTIKDNYTAELIRAWDNKISIMLTKEILLRFPKNNIKGIKQVGQPSYYTRRRPEDNQISLDRRVGDIINHLRACEQQHPAFFYYNKTKYYIYIEPEKKPDFPDDLEVLFFDPAQQNNTRS